MNTFQKRCTRRIIGALRAYGIELCFIVGGPDPFVALGEARSDFLEATFKYRKRSTTVTVYDDEVAFRDERDSYIAERQDFANDDALIGAFVARLHSHLGDSDGESGSSASTE